MPLGIFDSAYFSEVLDDRSSYNSPIIEINQEIRRKNVAAAAATTRGLQHVSIHTDTNSDPWDSFSESQAEDDPMMTEVEDASDVYNDHVVNVSKFSRRSSSGPRSPRRPSFATSNRTALDASNNSDRGHHQQTSNISPISGKTGPADFGSGFAWARSPRHYRFRASSIHLADPRISQYPSSAVAEDLDEPQHALALLQSTPQLRFLSPASTDMQGAGHSTSRNILSFIRPPGLDVANKTISGTTHHKVSNSNTASSSGNGGASMSEYRASLVRDLANRQAAQELASLLWVLAHEMSLEDYGTVESETFTSIFTLVHDSDKERRMAGLAALDALLAAPSADEEKKAIKFANTLSNGLRAAHGDFEFLSAVSKALGHMASKTANIDFVESEITRSLEWIRTERSDRRLAACLSLKEFAIHAPTTFHSKTSQSTLSQAGSNEFLDHIFQAVRDPQPVVRACAADALSQCLNILVDRRHLSLTGLLCQVHFSLMEGLQEDTSRKRPWHAIAQAEASQHGSLLVVSTMLAYTRDFMLPRFEEVCRAVLKFTDNAKALIRLEVVRLIPRLARRCPRVFGRRYLDQSLVFLIKSASSPMSPRVGVDIRPSAFTAIGQLIVAMTDETTGHVIGGGKIPTLKILDNPANPGSSHAVELCQRGIIAEKLEEIFALVRRGLSPVSSRSVGAATLSPALHCASNLVEALGETALPFITDLIDEMFRSGLSNDLIRCLHSIAQSLPAQQSDIEDRMLQEISVCLAGMRDVYYPLASFKSSFLQGRTPLVTINMSKSRDVVRSIVLSLQTLASFGDAMGRVTTSGAVVPLLPFVQEVVAKYLSHPSSEVRRAAALTCCVLLIPHGSTQKGRVGSVSGVITEDVLETLLKVAVSDPSAVVRLCVIRALDSRYDYFLCQTHHLQEIFLLLQDEALATRAAALRLLGRLATINPAPTLPVLRGYLNDLIVELQCGVDTGRGREEATRLLVFFLRAKSLQRLVHPVLPSLVTALPLDGTVPPRLASASLEALGELAQATGVALQPWVNEVLPHVLEIMQDQSSASKQRTSLRTLGQIAGSTGYVIRPYLDYPNLLTQATNVLPAAKRAPWSLRREVIRTLGILGALDPDRYHTVASKIRKGGAVGGAYFVEQDLAEGGQETTSLISQEGMVQANKPNSPKQGNTSPVRDSVRKNSISEPIDMSDEDDDLPAYLSMYEQYAMVAQPISNLSPPKRMTPSDEDFYPTVTIQALMRIFRDPSLAVHHGMVIQAIMFIFKSLGLRCVPYLNRVVPYMIYTIRNCGTPNLRESLLQQLATLSLIVREHLRPFVADIFDVVEYFWSSRHLATIFTLVSNLAIGVPEEFRRFVPRLIRRLLTTLSELQVGDWRELVGGNAMLSRGRVESEKLSLILKSVSSLRRVLVDYLHILIPSLLKLADALLSLKNSQGAESLWLERNETVLLELSVSVFKTISALLESQSSIPSSLSVSFYMDETTTSSAGSERGLSSRVVQPLVRFFQDKPPFSRPVGLAMVETLGVCARLIGGEIWLKLYDDVVRRVISGWEARFRITPAGEMPPPSLLPDDGLPTGLHLYDQIVEELLLPPSQRFNALTRRTSSELARRSSWIGIESFHLSSHDLSIIGVPFDTDAYDQSGTPSTATANRQVNQINLQRAWDVSQRASREDWDEWMRRLAIQLLREAPSPALRATASLAHAYQPLARELFSAAFACCWKYLSSPYRINLVHALKTAYVAKDVSPEILQALLNLAEFMEHDPLPIEIPVLAELALKCRAYAKALHYKEQEYSLGGSNSCVEALISINRKLDLQEAALGVLIASDLGEPHESYAIMEEELSPKFAGYQANKMCYSVIWGTEERSVPKLGSVDLTNKQELWLAKLGSWTEALTVYEEKLKRDPHDFEAMLGCMRCLDARGEWRKVLDLAEESWSSMSGGTEDVLKDESSPRSHRKALRMCTQAAWRLGQWDDLEKFVSQLVRGSDATVAQGSGANPSDGVLPHNDFDGAFYSAVLNIHRKEWALAADAIDAARKAMDGRLTALMAESYSRAYPSTVAAQTLAEMEEIIEFRKVEERSKAGSHRHQLNRPDAHNARERLLSVWRDRLAGCRVDAEVHASILAVRSLVLGPADEVDATIHLSELSRQSQQYNFAERVLLDPLAALNADLDGPTFGFGLSESLGIRVQYTAMGGASLAPIIDRLVVGDLSSIVPSYGPMHQQWSKSLVTEAGGLERLIIQYQLYSEYVKHLWFTDRKDEAMDRLGYLCDVVDMVWHCESVEDSRLRVSSWLELGEWKLSEAASPSSFITEDLQAEVLTAFKRASLLENSGYKAWHAWSLLNFRIALQISDHNDGGTEDTREHRGATGKALRNHVVAAVKGFVNAISTGTKRWSASVQQDLLNLLTLLFKYGDLQDVASVINDCIGTIAIEAWLGVLPQLLARIHIKEPSIRSVLHPLLTRLGEKHPQALIYPLSVLLKGPLAERKNSAESLMNSLKAHSTALVGEALLVSSELIRVAILWLETWHEGLEDASRLYFGEGNVAGMLELLLPLHEQLEKGAETIRENDFLKSFGQDLAQAHRHMKEYVRLVGEGGSSVPTRPAGPVSYDASGRLSRQSEEAETAMNRAWDIYYTVFRRINKQLPSLTKLELSQCSPALSRARSLELGVPGSYRVDGSYVKIEKFITNVQVITSKQRPRKITMRGNDGKDYVFLLKGHEDLRQDERVMQLFGLVNALLVRDPQTKKHDLKIQRYAVSPLSHNCGVVGWVPHCDTLHSLIRDYRQSKKVLLNMENREMIKTAPDYDLLTVMQKVEVFTEALKKTTGQGNDLYEILWLKSSNSEEWLEHRTRYTRSLAVMSMVGYILGLGDRHPSNLMLDKLSGRVLHIDFGDCFEVAMNREKYPEKVPFRLTRMLIKAMEISGIEGSYRSTCEHTMTVLRRNRDSLVAMLEAFVYDPLISWRLADLSPGATSGQLSGAGTNDGLRPRTSSSMIETAAAAAATNSDANISGVPIELLSGRGSVLRDPITEELNEDDEENSEHGQSQVPVPAQIQDRPSITSNRRELVPAQAASRARSLQMYSSIQNMAAALNTDSRIASITGQQSETVAVEGSIARSRIERSMKQRELFSILGGEEGAAHEEALNEKALKVIRRVQDKLTGTDFPDCDGEPLDVTDQVQRLIVQATSSENLCQLFIGWCAFW